VTWPEPDELDGADEPWRPLLDELPDFEELADLLALDPEVVADELWLVAVVCVDPGRLAATPPAATRLARPAATVTARILARLRFLAAICVARPVGRGWAGSGDIGCLPVGLDVPQLGQLSSESSLCPLPVSAERTGWREVLARTETATTRDASSPSHSLVHRFCGQGCGWRGGKLLCIGDKQEMSCG
jgi:hypothetical protein